MTMIRELRDEELDRGGVQGGGEAALVVVALDLLPLLVDVVRWYFFPKAKTRWSPQ